MTNGRDGRLDEDDATAGDTVKKSFIGLDGSSRPTASAIEWMDSTISGTSEEFRVILPKSPVGVAFEAVKSSAD